MYISTFFVYSYLYIYIYIFIFIFMFISIFIFISYWSVVHDMWAEVLSSLAYDFAGAKLTDIEICTSQGVMFIGAGAADTVSDGTVHILSTVQRSSPTKPVSQGTLVTGYELLNRKIIPAD